MSTRTQDDHSFEFYFPDVDTLLLAEYSEGRVLIRATKNTFTVQRKIQFIRRLAFEGFIPDNFQWLSDLDSKWLSVCWRIDHSWLKLPKNLNVRSRRFMVGLFASAILLWSGLMIMLLRGWL